MKILIAVDGSKHAMQSLQVAAQYVRLNGSAVAVANVIPSVADMDLELSVSDRDRLREDRTGPCSLGIACRGQGGNGRFGLEARLPMWCGMRRARSWYSRRYSGHESTDACERPEGEGLSFLFSSGPV